MQKNMRNLVKYAAHICGIYTAYAGYMQHIFRHISSICKFEWWRIIIMIINRHFLHSFDIFWLQFIQRLIAITGNCLPPKYLAVLKQHWTRKMLRNVIAYEETYGFMQIFCICGIIFTYAILKMPLCEEKYAICGFWQNMHVRTFN